MKRAAFLFLLVRRPVRRGLRSSSAITLRVSRQSAGDRRHRPAVELGPDAGESQSPRPRADRRTASWWRPPTPPCAPTPATCGTAARSRPPTPSRSSTAGKPLNSGAAAFWKVQVWDQDGQPSEWSAPAQWSMGLLRAGGLEGQVDRPRRSRRLQGSRQRLSGAGARTLDLGHAPTRRPPRRPATASSARPSPFPRDRKITRAAQRDRRR